MFRELFVFFRGVNNALSAFLNGGLELKVWSVIVSVNHLAPI